ncbi:hypothetical protein BBJ28_00008598 [Nothophytophthora sp. Chile5]|nr:hypothetical protein BBJ28_00008598 [Nothophytophthora sp. Chile5]
MATQTPDCERVMQAFLQEMEELDRVQQPAKREVETADATPALKKRAVGSAKDHQRVAEAPMGVKRPSMRRKPSSYERRKQELETLRQQTQVMETRVAFLQIQRPQSMSRSTGDPSGQQKEWKAVVTREKQHRQEAEDDNERLKDRLKLLVQTSGALQTALTVANAHRCHFADTTTTARSLRLQLGTGQWLGCAGIFDVLEYRVNARSHELETIFRESYRPLTGADTTDVHIRHDDEELSAAAVEFKLARLLPFHETAASDAIWEMIELDGAQDEFVSCTTKRSEDVIANINRFRIPMEGGKTVTLNMHGVLKRFEVPGGLVILLESTAEWSTASSSWEHSTRASGWVIVRRYPMGGSVIASGDMTPCACQLRSIIRLKPRKIKEDGAKAAESLLPRTVSDVVIPSFSKMLGSRLQCIENMLLDSTKTVGI